VLCWCEVNNDNEIKRELDWNGHLGHPHACTHTHVPTQRMSWEVHTEKSVAATGTGAGAGIDTVCMRGHGKDAS
jgi:hypothetical protein